MNLVGCPCCSGAVRWLCCASHTARHGLSDITEADPHALVSCCHLAINHCCSWISCRSRSTVVISAADGAPGVASWCQAVRTCSMWRLMLVTVCQSSHVLQSVEAVTGNMKSTACSTAANSLGPLMQPTHTVDAQGPSFLDCTPEL